MCEINIEISKTEEPTRITITGELTGQNAGRNHSYRFNNISITPDDINFPITTNSFTNVSASMTLRGAPIAMKYWRLVRLEDNEFMLLTIFPNAGELLRAQ